MFFIWGTKLGGRRIEMSRYYKPFVLSTLEFQFASFHSHDCTTVLVYEILPVPL